MSLWTSIRDNTVKVLSSPIVNPVGVGVQALTGIKPATQLAIGATAGGAALVAGAAAPAAAAGSTTAAGGTVATAGTLGGAGALAAAKPVADAIKTQLTQPQPAESVAATQKPEDKTLLYLGAGLLAVKILIL